MERRGNEEGDFPIACETCLGDSSTLRIIKGEADKECKVCQRPCTSFRWQPGPRARYKSSVICQMCARMQNICQVCLFDLQYGLPVQVRDQILSESRREQNPVRALAHMSAVNRDFATQRIEAEAAGLGGAAAGDTAVPAIENAGFDRDAAENAVLRQVARMAPYYKRNEARVCTFWLKGACNRGDRCPFKHEQDSRSRNAGSVLRIRERYFGVNDEFAQNMLASIESRKQDRETGAGDRTGDRDQQRRSAARQDLRHAISRSRPGLSATQRIERPASGPPTNNIIIPPPPTPDERPPPMPPSSTRPSSKQPGRG
ncbi:zinc finger protein [Gregarina niphandrodes]|uniref:Zinc finger protein n=1 Tax=Gregarina niphandrodes TaxID=110365 RepID=A0A023B3D6_GRENI|nr:zinc finger protein [Gregarina niphandrodes]EZG55239.1 zinc finger protein [Gregarina niphandrodes]|eukprot:XP_011131690.1 zinc finger protein [Gregarina niphandrodes]